MSFLKVLLPILGMSFLTCYIFSSVSPETDTFCRKLLQEAGINNPERISIIPVSESTGACVFFNKLGINEKFLNSLPAEQQRFILGHEAIHIKNNHSIKGLALGVVLLSCMFIIQSLWDELYHALINKIDNKKIKNFFENKLTERSLETLVELALFFVPMIAYNWSRELEATREGTRALNCVDGALGYLNSITSGAQSLTKFQKVIRFFQRIPYHMKHPPTSWHLAEVKNLQNTYS